MSRWREGENSMGAIHCHSNITQHYLYRHLNAPSSFKTLHFLFRVHLHLRATWRVWQVCWKQTFQTTKTKSCEFYVLCKFSPVDGIFRANLVLHRDILKPWFICSARILPEKLTVYTTLVGLLNARNYNFGGEFVEAMIRQLKETLKNNLYDEAVHLVSWSFTSTSKRCECTFVHSILFLLL